MAAHGRRKAPAQAAPAAVPAARAAAVKQTVLSVIDLPTFFS